jgi:hypothetical protein
VFVDHLALGRRAYEVAWEKWELLQLIETTYQRDDAAANIQRVARAAENLALAREKAEQLKATNDVDALEDAEAAQRQAWEDHGRALGKYADTVRVENPHLRVQDNATDNTHRPAAGRSLIIELERQQAAHPLVQAGLCGGDWQNLSTTCHAVNVAVARRADSATNEMMGGQGGIVPAYFWLDTSASS